MDTARPRGSQPIERRGALTHARVEALFSERKKMLLTLRGDISTSLSDVLWDKIAHEHAALTTMLIHDTHAEESERKAHAVLRREYFTKKKFDIRTI